VAQKVYSKKCNLQEQQRFRCFLQRERHTDTTLMGQVKIRREAQKTSKVSRVDGMKKKKAAKFYVF
jgi:hypothetical protein